MGSCCENYEDDLDRPWSLTSKVPAGLVVVLTVGFALAVFGGR